MFLRNKYSTFRHLTTSTLLPNPQIARFDRVFSVQFRDSIANMGKPTVLLCPPLPHVRKEWESLSSKAVLKVRKTYLIDPQISRRSYCSLYCQESKAQSKKDFLAELKSGQYDGVSVIFRSNAASTVSSLKRSYGVDYADSLSSTLETLTPRLFRICQ